MLTTPDFAHEISFKTSRSGGKGGQNVNKVETAVMGFWNPAESVLFDEEEKTLLAEKLQHLMNAAGEVYVKSQVHRSQGANKEEVIKKFRALVQKALVKKKPRIATRRSKGAIERRLEAKKWRSEVKQMRGKVGLE
jgi:ribosome-associated protein